VTERGGAWSSYLATNRSALREVASRVLADDETSQLADSKVTLVDYDPDGEVKAIAAMLYSASHLPETVIEDQVRAMSVDDRIAVVRAYVGERGNRRHKPGRALERTSYRFDVLSDYGAFRDLQRHRLLTIEWQDLSPRHGFVRPESVADAGAMEQFDAAMATSAELHRLVAERFPAQASYAVALAYRVRYVMQMNAREAMHLIELRSAPQGHPSYRVVAQDMHHLIAEGAGHRAIAEMMRFVDHDEGPELGRLEAERRAEVRRGGVAPASEVG
jgi:hypothetical protein